MRANRRKIPLRPLGPWCHSLFPVSSHMTLTETILARASGRPRVQPGDNVWVNTDILLTHDVCGPGTIGVFHREFGRDAKVWDRDKIVIIPDHYIFTADSMSNRNVDILRDVRARTGAAVFLRRDRRSRGRVEVRRLAGPAQAPVRRAPSRACATRPCPKRATSGPARCSSARIRTPAWRGRSGSSPPASATPTRVLSWARANCSSRCPRRCASISTARCKRASWPRT